MILSWLVAYGWTFVVIEPLQVLALAGAPCMFDERHCCGRCMIRLRTCYNELLAP